MADLLPVAGCKIYIGDVLAPKNANFVAADYSAITWVEIDGWKTMGSFGDTATLITDAIINRGRDQKQKGTKNAGAMENVFGTLNLDPGQIAMAAAQETDDNYAFKIEFNDMPSGGASNTEALFIGLVMGTPRQGGGANDPRNTSSTIEINSNIVFVPAA